MTAKRRVYPGPPAVSICRRRNGERGRLVKGMRLQRQRGVPCWSVLAVEAQKDAARVRLPDVADRLKHSSFNPRDAKDQPSTASRLDRKGASQVGPFMDPLRNRRQLRIQNSTEDGVKSRNCVPAALTADWPRRGVRLGRLR